MYRSLTRWLAWLMLLAICAGLFTLPAMAAEGPGEQSAAASEIAQTEEEGGKNLSAVDPIGSGAETGDADAEAPDGFREETPADPADGPAAGADEETSADEPSAGPDEQTPADDPAADPDEQTPGASEELALDGGLEITWLVSYYNGEELIATEPVVDGEKPAQVPATANGAAIKAWTAADGALAEPADTAVTADVAYYAWFMPRLNSTDHIRYINGLGNAQFGPNASLTRAQAAKILYELLVAQDYGPYPNDFTDVPDGKWYTEPIRVLASIGVLKGDGNGLFRPNSAVRRSEFVTMLVRLTDAVGSASSFTDTEGHWASDAINAAASSGWINGYGDGTFRPNAAITRAQAVKVVNCVLGRTADLATIAAKDDILHFIDVPENAWYYPDVMEASIGHTHLVTSDGEVWAGYNVESSGMTPGLHQIDKRYVYINENGQPQRVPSGVSKAGDRFVYSAATSAGYTFVGDLSSRPGYAVFSTGAQDYQLTDGFNLIDNTYFYWGADKNEPQALSAGVNLLPNNSACWADSDGYVIHVFRDSSGAILQKGVVTVEGKKYLVSGGLIVAKANAYASDKGKPSFIDLRGHTYDFEGYMYYIQDDYSVLTNGYHGYLYFDANGRYTSGDAALDAKVDSMLSGFINNSNLSREQKLLLAYYELRGWNGTDPSVFVSNGFSYWPKGLMFYTRAYNYVGSVYDDFRDCAKQMLTEKRGRCYEWASGYLYLARRLGFQGYLVVGWINDSYSSDSGNVHCWCMIPVDGNYYLSDVETEWGWLSGHYSSSQTSLYRNMFDQDYSPDHLQYLKTLSDGRVRYWNSKAMIGYTFPAGYTYP